MLIDLSRGAGHLDTAVAVPVLRHSALGLTSQKHQLADDWRYTSRPQYPNNCPVSRSRINRLVPQPAVLWSNPRSLLNPLPQLRPDHTLLEQLRLASVRVVEAVFLWREDIQASRTTSSPPSDGGDHLPTMPQNPPSSTAAGAATGAASAATGRQGEQEVGGTTVRNGEEHPGTLLSQQQLRGEGDIATGAGDSTCRSGNDQAIDLDQENPSTGKTRKRPGAPSGGNGSGSTGGGGSGQGTSNPAEAGGGVGRGVKGRWVATMMVPGRKLWDSSPAMMSQYKRFRRSRQDPKIARDQVHDA